MKCVILGAFSLLLVARTCLAIPTFPANQDYLTVLTPDELAEVWIHYRAPYIRQDFQIFTTFDGWTIRSGLYSDLARSRFTDRDDPDYPTDPLITQYGHWYAYFERETVETPNGRRIELSTYHRLIRSNEYDPRLYKLFEYKKGLPPDLLHVPFVTWNGAISLARYTDESRIETVTWRVSGQPLFSDWGDYRVGVGADTPEPSGQSWIPAAVAVLLAFRRR